MTEQEILIDIDLPLTQEKLQASEEKVFSQNGEDGVIQAIFEKIGTTNQFAVEFGAGNATECNTAALIKYFKWQALLMDHQYEIKDNHFAVYKEHITRGNINRLFKKYNVPRNFDLLSIDIDGNDYWVWKSLSPIYQPRLVIIEYNATYPWSECATISYEPHFSWAGTDYFGASLGALVQLGKKKGYTLVYCEQAGVNAFFVRNDLIPGNFVPTSTEVLYQPPNYFNLGISHPKDPHRKLIPLGTFYVVRSIFNWTIHFLKEANKKISKSLYSAVNSQLTLIFKESAPLLTEPLSAQLQELSSMTKSMTAHFDAIQVLAIKTIPNRIQEETCIKQLMANTPEGQFYFDVKDTVIGWSIGQHQTWEKMETDFIKSLIKKDDFVIDIGANLGWYSVLLGNLVGKNGLVLAFEPEPYNFELLTKNILLNKLNHCVKPFQLALLDKESEIIFELCPQNFGYHRPKFNQTLGQERLNESSRLKIKVSAQTLDFIMKDYINSNHRFKLLKIDSQGCEAAIFKGAAHTLSLFEYMICEFWPYGLSQAGSTVEAWVNLITPHFNEFSRIGSKPLVFKHIETLAQDIHEEMDVSPGPLGYTNYVFKKSE